MGDLVNIFVTSFENYLEVGYISLSFFEEKVRRPNRQFATSFVNYLKLDHVSFDFKRMKYMEMPCPLKCKDNLFLTVPPLCFLKNLASFAN